MVGRGAWQDHSDPTRKEYEIIQYISIVYKDLIIPGLIEKPATVNFFTPES